MQRVHLQDLRNIEVQAIHVLWRLFAYSVLLLFLVTAVDASVQVLHVTTAPVPAPEASEAPAPSVSSTPALASLTAAPSAISATAATVTVTNSSASTSTSYPLPTPPTHSDCLSAVCSAVTWSLCRLADPTPCLIECWESSSSALTYGPRVQQAPDEWSDHRQQEHHQADCSEHQGDLSSELDELFPDLLQLMSV